MVANTTLVNTHLLTFLKEVLIENLLVLFSIPKHVINGLLGFFRLIVCLIIYRRHTKFCENIKDERLRYLAYVKGLPPHLTDANTHNPINNNEKEINPIKLPKP